MFAAHTGQRRLQLRVDQQDARPAMVHDVLHFFGDQPEVDRHQNAPPATDTKKRGQQARRVVADHGYALPHADSQRIQTRRLRSGTRHHLPVAQSPPAGCRLQRLIHAGGALRINLAGTAQMVRDGERYFHAKSPLF